MTSPSPNDYFLAAPEGCAEDLLRAWHVVNAQQTLAAMRKAVWVRG